MKPDPEYLKKLLVAFSNAPEPTTDIRELQEAGIDYDDPKFEFHMHLLLDHGYIESESRKGGFGLEKSADGYRQWSVIPLRLTASGHEFAEALESSKAMEAVKKNLVGASLSTIKDLAVAAFKAELSKHTGLHL